MDLATNGKFIMTCSNKNDLVLYDIRGEVLTRIDTCQMTTYTARISPCGRFVATSGFTPDVKVGFQRPCFFLLDRSQLGTRLMGKRTSYIQYRAT
jgi:hypothetical protein